MSWGITRGSIPWVGWVRVVLPFLTFPKVNVGGV